MISAISAPINSNRIHIGATEDTKKRLSEKAASFFGAKREERL
jgi:hypothetical protein